MANYEHGISYPHEAWFELNVIANYLGADYSFAGIQLAAREVARQHASLPRDPYPDVSAFGSFGELALQRTMTVYANRYAVQNIRELPYVWELINLHDYDLGKQEDDWMRTAWGKLGAIWFFEDWRSTWGNYAEGTDREDYIDRCLYVDSDPEWRKFINAILKLISQEGISQILFYWP